MNKTPEQQMWFDGQAEKARDEGIENPCVRWFGPDLVGRHCKDCRRLYRGGGQAKFFKCELRKETSGPGSDHRAKWKACAKFEERKTKEPKE